MKLVFAKKEKKFATSLSAMVRVGEDVWAGGDEGTAVGCLRRASKKNETFAPVAWVDLVDELDLPDKAVDGNGRRSEIDLEGCDWEGERGYLWVLGSHSLKRTAAKFSDDGEELGAAENLARLAKVSADGNRFLLGRIPLRVEAGRSEAVRCGAYTGQHFGARLDCTAFSSELLDALRTDPLFGRFLLPGQELPGKDNGLDFEGLAFNGESGRLLVGMRGPVLRGMAVVLELMIEEEFRGADRPGKLRLRRFGAGGPRYRRHFLDLDGLSVRDLCFRNKDLLILAGPTMAVDWPVTVYRWKKARAALAATEEETFVWQESGELELLEDLAIDPPGERGSDRAEGLAIWGERQLAIVFDSPSPSRWEKPATVAVDVVDFPGVPISGS
jgi:hypothetical protein